MIRLRDVQIMAEYPASVPGSEPDFEVEIGAPPLAATATAALAVDPEDTRYADSAVVAFAPAMLGAAGTDWRFRFRNIGGEFADFDPSTLDDTYLVIG